MRVYTTDFIEVMGPAIYTVKFDTESLGRDDWFIEFTTGDDWED